MDGFYFDTFVFTGTGLYVLVGFVGACVGSFLNVVIHRLPAMLEYQWHCHCQEALGGHVSSSPPDNLMRPRSRCTHCGSQVKAQNMVPLVSYFLLKGKCASCGQAISLRYAVVEWVSFGLSLYAVYVFGPSIALVFSLVFCWLLVALFFIDMETQLLPDCLTLPLLWMGVLANYFALFTSLESSVLGAILGYLVFWLIYQIHHLTTGKQGMGRGDFKLLGAVGAWVGWELLPFVILAASVCGTLFALSGILLKKYSAHSPIAFGPFLAGAGCWALFWGDQLITSYASFVGL